MNLSSGIKNCLEYLLHEGKIIKTTKWQGVHSPPPMIEVLNATFEAQIPETELELVDQTKPHLLDWCREHFLERIGGEPLNPPPSHERWLMGTDKFLDHEIFSHTYPERFWPSTLCEGIRFEVGDLSTLIRVLRNEPDTRQAVLPMYYPEDLTAALEHHRVPCSLYWHFMLRDDQLHCWYDLRSCDAHRHFAHDVYLACRLAQWVRDQALPSSKMGKLHFRAHSFHAFENDRYGISTKAKKYL
jgi:hypothetical protein